MKMIERIARAICKADIPDAPYDDKDWINFNRDHWHAVARAALEVILAHPGEYHLTGLTKRQLQAAIDGADERFTDAA